MLISRVSEGEGEGRDAGEYRTADQLFELMAKDHNYDASDNPSLSTRDLIILYKNIDVGTKLMSSANVGQHKAPNQHVETVVYKDERESDDSDVSEIYSNEDLQDVFSINNERIDLINNLSSVQHPLCHKFGDIEFQSSNFSEYDSHFLFKDPYIKQQLKNINILPDSTEFDTILPATLLDYICCKRLEDNYNFYMDNIIRYVQHTIEQLKRISNGDYLTDRAKEKWREVAKDLVIPNSDSTKVLATSVSIPIHVMGKVDGHRSTWDDIVHSELDVRSLSKILEKKIVIEVPKLICGSYRLFSERCADSLIISCKKDVKRDVDQDNGKSRVDVVFQLKPSGSGHVISNINSIMILQKMPSITTTELSGGQHADRAVANYNDNFEERPKILEIDEQDHTEELKPVVINSVNNRGTLDVAIKESVSDSSNCSSLKNCLRASKSNVVDKGLLNKKVCIKTLKTETDLTVISPDELRCAIRKLNMQTPVPEESEESCIIKKKSPTRVRIKSPYENQSYSIEEKKRKKLLEIREKREKKKMALSENCKVTKHKYGKGAIMAQPSSSVTKLSITNKSFYNSIYGENVNQEGGTSKNSRKLQRNDMFEQDSSKGECENTFYKSSFTALDRSTFDDETTETIMQLQRKLDTETYSIPISANTNYSADVNLLSQLIGSSGTDYNSDDDTSPVRKIKRNQDEVQEIHEGVNDMADLGTYQSPCILVPVNTPKESPPGDYQDGIRKTTTPVECRKSIEKIYELLKKIGKHDNEITASATRHVLNNTEDLNVDGGQSSTMQVTDSGTSVKHHAVSSNPSTFSFGKNNNLSRHTYKDKKKKEVPATVVPKVIIGTKFQTSKINAEWNKTDRKRVITSPSPKVPDNPLKAISQLLHEFHNVQKTRHKTYKKDDHVLVDCKTVSRQDSSKKPRQEPSSKDNGLATLKSSSYKDRRPRPIQPPDLAQLSHQLTHVEDKHAGRLSNRNLSDIIDEAKEARGEAVRGPPKSYSRINSLAQPKKSYVQAHNDEYQNKYGKNITANRLNRLTAPLVEKNTVNPNNARNRRKGPEIVPVPSPKPGISTVPPLERIMGPGRSASNSPARKRVQPQSPIDPACRPTAAPKTPDLKKKMVAVESYVKNHYGHMPIDTSELKDHEVEKSRVPLISNDIELASLSSPIAEESTALGNQLHYMVDTMINTNAPPLSVLTEYRESTSKLSDGLEKLSTESLLKIDEQKSESDYTVDIFEDKSILTAVAGIPKDKVQGDKIVDENFDSVDAFDVQLFNSATELRKLENALYQRMSVGAFPKRLRIKNLTLTPKPSFQQVIVVQSGDVGSLLVKSSVSQSLRTDSKTDSSTAVKPLAALSNTNINWGFTNIPMQVATIAYAFPTFQSSQRNTLAHCVQALMEKPSNEDISKDVCKSHKTSQCFKGVHTESSLEQATQANIVLSRTSTCNINMGTSTEQKEIVTKELRTAKNFEKIQPVTTLCERIRLTSEKCERGQTAEASQRSQPKAEKSKIILSGKETCENVQQMTQQCERIQPIPAQSEIVQTKRAQQDTTKDITISKTSKLNINQEIIEGEAEEKSSKIIDHSTSLDILMGLLNEIRKITGEAINNNIDDEHEQTNQCKEFEIILNNAATNESSIDNNCRDLVSVSSYDKLNQLYSSPSTCSFNMLKERVETITNVKNKDIIEIVKDSPADCYKSKKVDKEVTVDIEKQYLNKLTDVPSCFFPFTINQNTNIDDSVIEIQREPSTLSVYSFAKYETLDCNSSLGNAQEQPKAANQVLSTVDNMDAGCFNIVNGKRDEKIVQESPSVNIESVAVVSSSRSRYKRTSKMLTRSACAAIGSNFDPLLKIKRDVLVTVYSILVFTVFAALSFPKVFFHEEM